MILKIQNLTGGYSQGHDILQGVELEIQEGDSAGIIEKGDVVDPIGFIGLNGSGKSTFAKAIMNCLPYRSGSLLFKGLDISKKSTQELSQMGIVLFTQGGRIFDELSVYENLLFIAKDKQKIDAIKEYFVTFQVDTVHLRKMRANKLSGGERLQLALAMCFLKNPSLLIMDEPSAGLSPLAVNEMYRTLETLRIKNNLTTILIEQNISRAVDFCSSLNLLRNGKIEYNADQLKNKSLIIEEIRQIMFNK